MKDHQPSSCVCAAHLVLCETGVSLHGATKDTDSPVLYRPNSRTEDPAAGVLVAHDGAGALLEFDAADGMFVRWEGDKLAWFDGQVSDGSRRQREWLLC